MWAGYSTCSSQEFRKTYPGTPDLSLIRVERTYNQTPANLRDQIQLHQFKGFLLHPHNSGQVAIVTTIIHPSIRLTPIRVRRKGINSLVLEKSDSLRATGAAIGIFINGWRALYQLGVGSALRSKAIPISEMHDVWLHKDLTKVTPCRKAELRCFKRSDLVDMLAENLPKGSIRFGCPIITVDIDRQTSFPILLMDDGSIINAKVLIGCDGSNSVIAKSLGLEPPKLFPNSVIRGLTNYKNGHNFGSSFLRQMDAKMIFGRIPIDDKLVHWFVDWERPPTDAELPKEPKLMKDLAMDLLKDYPPEVTEMVEKCDTGSLSVTHVRYRAPWHLLFASLWKGTTTVAGDAMHVMGPFLGQGGAAALEDAVVLGRCLAEAVQMSLEGRESRDQGLRRRVEAALAKYVRERRLRVLRLSIQTYVASLMMAPSRAMRLASLVLLFVLFGGLSLSHTEYDCGQL